MTKDKAKVSTKRSRREKEEDEVLSLTLVHRKKTTSSRPRTLWNKTLVFRGPVTLDLFTNQRPFEYDDFARQLSELSRLPDVQCLEAPVRVPLLPPVLRRFSRKKTLVLDIDETLVHSELDPVETTGFDFVFQVTHFGPPKTVGMRKRPFVEDFIAWCGENFELVTFTSSVKQYADQVIDWLDPDRKAVKYRLYRESCTSLGNEFYLKNLEHLRRDLNGVLIVDNSPIAFAYQMDNGIPIESFYGINNSGEEDTELLKLKNFLEEIIQVDDVRPMIRQTFKLKEVALKFNRRY